VPVGAYLSGGLDSSTTTSIIQRFSDTPLETFSIQFSTPEYDEHEFQQQMVNSLNVNHHTFTCTPEDIGTVFPEVIWHTETPILRTSPAPMFILSDLVHQNKYKVVLTGEGADEILAGYDIFKEDYIRRFVARRPQSTKRPILFQALYPEIPQLSQNSAFLQAFFGKDIAQTGAPFYSHHLRWSNTARTNRFLENYEEFNLSPESYPIDLPGDFMQWSPLARAQYLEITTFLTPYLLSSQGDRMAMAHAVEGRYPFLDYRLVEFANRLPNHHKLRGLQEKWILRQFAKKILPKEIWQRRKRPYRAPIHHSFFNHQVQKMYVNELLDQKHLAKTALFSPTIVPKLLNKASKSAQLSEIEEMALVGIISSQLFYDQFIQKKHTKPILNQNTPFRIIDRLNITTSTGS
jgi:asparagine synthase (glutamine-hydrolysing)